MIGALLLPMVGTSRSNRTRSPLPRHVVPGAAHARAVLGGVVFLLIAGGFLLLQVDLQDPNASAAARLLPVDGSARPVPPELCLRQFDRLISLFRPPSRSSGRSAVRGRVPDWRSG